MYRRRRPQHNKIHFSFDSFLDLVTNVIGIIIRLILVTWVGARAYTAAMLNSSPEPAGEEPTVAAAAPLEPLAAPRAEDDPVSKDLQSVQNELKKLRNSLTSELSRLDLIKSRETEASKALTLADAAQQKLVKDRKATDDVIDRSSKDVANLAMSKEDLLRQKKTLQEELEAVKKLPSPTKQLRYHTPVSRPVRSDQLHFECLKGRIAFIDVQALEKEIKDREAETINALQQRWKFDSVTSQIGDFRLHYSFERVRGFEDRLIDAQSPNKRSRMTGAYLSWQVEPMADVRGEPFEAALRQGSAFRQILDGVDPDRTVVTLWVYPDSFAMFRRLRDILHDREIEVAAWPIPFGERITASPDGSASRGQ